MRLAAFALALVAAAPALGQERAGVSAAVRGEVQVASAGGASGAAVVGRQARSGEPIFLGDRIRSAVDSGMQLMLLDETTFTVGPSSEIAVDRFIYDPERGRGEVAVSVARGAFRFVTGKIARADPRSMEVSTPAGTIGIRGTIVYGRVDGTRVTVALGGPGGSNNAGTRRGGFDFTPPGGRPIEVRRPGWAIVAEPGIPVQLIELPRERLDAMSLALEARGPLAAAVATATAGGVLTQASSQRAQRDSDQSRARGSQTLQVLDIVVLPPPALSDLVVQIAQQSFGFHDLTTFDQLLSIPSGSASFGQTGVTLLNAANGAPVGSYDFNATIDFGARTATGAMNNITAGAPFTVTSGTVALNSPGDYSGLGGFGIPAFVQGSNIGGCGGTADCTGQSLFQNKGGAIAKTATHTLVVQQGGNTAVGQGSVDRLGP